MSNILDLPLELLRQVVGYLDFRAFCTFATAHPVLSALLLESESTCLQVVRKWVPRSREARLARDGRWTYRTALLNAFRRREAFALARPYALVVLGIASDFLYRDGVLCYLRGASAHILRVHDASPVELVLDLAASLGVDGGAARRWRLLHQQDDVLVVSSAAGPETLLVAYSTAAELDPGQRRILFSHPIVAGRRDCVRHDAGTLVYGVYVGQEEDECYWKFWSFGLTGRRTRCSIGNFSTATVDSNVVFEVIDGYFYVVTSQITNDPEGADPTSYYGGCRYALREPKPKPEYWRVWRRQQREGPIHDLWTDLALRKDETGELVILETRREWQTGSSKPRRTFYTQPLRLDPADPDSDFFIPSPSTLASTDGPAASQSIPMATASQRSGTVEYMLCAPEPARTSPRVRLPRHAHPEFPPDAPALPADVYEFTLATTKHRSYNLSASTSLDLVTDPQQPADLRLRTAARAAASPLAQTGLLHRPACDPRSGRPLAGTEDRFRARPICLWPAADAHAGVRRLMRAGSGRVKAVADERSVVFRRPDGALVLVCFDPAARFDGLVDLRRDAGAGGDGPVGGTEPASGEAVGEGSTAAAAAAVRLRPAAWVGGHGFRLR